MAIFDDLGSMIGGAPEAIASTWKSLVDSPEKQAALTSFGLQLMAGGHGDQFQRLAVAAGHGMESASATEEAIRQHKEKERAFAAGQQEKAADRASREKVAQIGADSRLEVAQHRVAGMLERTKMNLDKADPSTKLQYENLARKVIDTDFKSLSLGWDEKLRLIRSEADRMYTEDVMSGKVKAPGGGGGCEGTGCA